MAEKQIVCFQSKKVKICRIFYFNYYIYLKRYFEKVVTYFFSIFWSTAALNIAMPLKGLIY